MRKEYLNLSIRDFLDIISGEALSRIHSILLSRGRKMEGTISELVNAAIEYKGYDIEYDIIEAVNSIMEQPCYQFGNFSKLDISNYIRDKTGNFDPESLEALLHDILDYTEKNEHFKAMRKHLDNGNKEAAKKHYTNGLENLRYARKMIISKLEHAKVKDLADPEPQQSNIVPIPSGLSPQQLHSIYAALAKHGFISLDTDSESSFLWLLGSGEEPIPFNATKWIGQKNQCAYFVDKFNFDILGNGNAERRILWKPFEHLFDIDNLRGAKNDYGKTGVPPDKSKILDAIIEQFKE